MDYTKSARQIGIKERRIFMDWNELASKLEQFRLRKKANKFPDHPTDKQYDANATYTEGGDPKFPLRENAPDSVLKKDISDAKRLENKVSPENQAKVEQRIQKIEKEKGWGVEDSE